MSIGRLRSRFAEEILPDKLGQEESGRTGQSKYDVDAMSAILCFYDRGNLSCNLRLVRTLTSSIYGSYLQISL